MDLIASLREHTSRIVKEFVSCGPKGACSRATVLALTALGIAAAGGTGSIAALLSGIGLNIGASALFQYLSKLSDKEPCGPTLEEALAGVQALGEQEQAALQQVADRLDVMPMLFGEALAQHRQELIADIGGLLATWGSTLPFAKMMAMLERIEEETRGVSPLQADVTAIRAQLSALHGGLQQNIEGQLAPLTAEVRALRGQVDVLLAQLAPSPQPPAAPASPRRRGGGMGRELTDQIMAALREEMRRETGSLLS